MKKYFFLVQIAWMFLAANASGGTTLPENAIRKIVRDFPQCGTSIALAVPVMGSLYGGNKADIAVNLDCEKDVRMTLVLLQGKDGNYRIVGHNHNDTKGSYDGFGLAIRKNSLFIHVSYPGREIAYVYDYQFRVDGGRLMLIGTEIQTYYHGSEERSAQSPEYHVSVNYLTGKVVDGRRKSASQRMTVSKRFSFEEFLPGMEFEHAIIDGY